MVAENHSSDDNCDLRNLSDFFYTKFLNTKEARSYFKCEHDSNGTTPQLTDLAICAYVQNTDACEGGGYYPWSAYELCAYDAEVKQALIVVAAVVLFIYLFLLLSTTADDFFCANIATIVDYHKISQNVAGITFMAFGNGAPDIFTSIASVMSAEKPQTELAISELLGGCIFVTTVVVAAIVLTQPFDVMRRPIIRDMLFYIFPIGILYISVIQNHEYKIIEPILFLIIYAIYAFTVISGSFVHRKISKRKRRSRINKDVMLKVAGFTPEPTEKRKRGRSSSSVSLSRARVAPIYGIRNLTATDLTVNDDRYTLDDKTNNNTIGNNINNNKKGGQQWRSVSVMADNRKTTKIQRPYSPAIIQTEDLSNIRPKSTAQASPSSSEESGTTKSLVGPAKKLIISIDRDSSDDFDEPPARSFLSAGKFFAKAELDDEESEDTMTNTNDSTMSTTAMTYYSSSDDSPQIATVESPDATVAERKRRVNIVHPRDTPTYAFPPDEITYGNNNKAHHHNHHKQQQKQQRHLFAHHNLDLMPSESNFDVGMWRLAAQRISPIKPTEFWAAHCLKKIFQVVKIPCSLILNLTVPLAEAPWSKPLAILHATLLPLLFVFAFKLHASLLAIVNVWALIGIYVGYVALISVILMTFTNWRRTPKYYSIISAYVGFAASIAWIYRAASEVVSIVIMFGNMLNITNQILGLTAVAWSNCIGDMVADISVARKGFPRMAFSAAIGGPLFNILVGFGSTFTLTYAMGSKTIKFDGASALQTVAVIKVMLITLSISLLATLTFLFVRKFRMKRANGVFLIFLYMSFLVVCIFVSVTNSPVSIVPAQLLAFCGVKEGG